MNIFYSITLFWKSYFQRIRLLLQISEEKNLRELFARADPYNIKTDLLNQTDLDYKKCGHKCDSCNNFVLEKTFVLCLATGTEFKICRYSTCNTKNFTYLAYCKNYNKWGVGSCI